MCWASLCSAITCIQLSLDQKIISVARRSGSRFHRTLPVSSNCSAGLHVQPREQNVREDCEAFSASTSTTGEAERCTFDLDCADEEASPSGLSKPNRRANERLYVVRLCSKFRVSSRSARRSLFVVRSSQFAVRRR